jgi:endogenous inhibitor of DNA gyrase (YacG/DUF329 family)
MTDSDRSDGECPTCGAVADEFVSLEAVFVCNECNTWLDETNAVPISELEQLADEFIKQRTGHAEVDQAYENAGSRIYRLIADYTDE